MKAKSINAEILDVSGRTIVAYVSKFGNVDLDGDVMMQGCYKKSIIERGKSGTNSLYHLSNHRPSPEFVLSKPVFEEDSYGLKMTSTIVETKHGEDIIKLYENELINEHSVMFTAMSGKYEYIQVDGRDVCQINEAKLYEGSTVVWGANPETPTISMKSVYKECFDNDIKKAFNQLTKLTKAIKKGTFTDEMFSLLELQYKMLESFILDEIESKTIQPTIVAEPTIEKVESTDDIVLKFLQDLKQELK